MALYFKPDLAVVGDVIPFYDQKNNLFRIFYLRNYRNNIDADHHDSWAIASTVDQLHFTEGDTHIDAATGSVVYDGHQYHMFATVFQSRPMKNYIIHAISEDCETWSLLDEKFYPDGKYYEEIHWRDPYVFYCQEESNWWMLTAARSKGKSLRRACVGLSKSTDLHKWVCCPPIYSPESANCAYECPDYFKMGDWYYLVFSSYSDRFQTLYRMSRSPMGPWIAPENDCFDTRAFYAAKTASDGINRYVYGWNPTRQVNEFYFDPEKDYGNDNRTWDWGGNLIIHKLIQNQDGSLAVSPPESVNNLMKREVPLNFEPVSGDWSTIADTYSTNSKNGYSCALLGNMPIQPCKLSISFRFSGDPIQLGFAFSIDETFSSGYYLAIEPGHKRIQFKTWIRNDPSTAMVFPYEAESERTYEFASNIWHHITAFRDGSVMEIYIDDQIVLGTRAYDRSGFKWGIFSEGGEVTFSNLHCRITEK